MSGGSAPGFGKDPLTPCHGDSLVDQSFQSLKSKEIRDSMSPTSDMKFHSMTLNQPNSTGWDVQTSSEVSPDGRAYRSETLATTGGVEKINGGLAEFKGRNEQRSSASHEGDDRNFVEKAAESSKTHLQEQVVVGDEKSGRTEMKTSSTTSSSSSKVISSSSTVENDNEPVHNRYLTDNTNQYNKREQYDNQQHQHQHHHHQQQQQQYEQQQQRRMQEERQQFEHQIEQQQQQQQQHSEQYNREEVNTRRNVETQKTYEENKRYVDMDKASPEYQRQVQHLMAQPGEIISNTVEYPKPNVKLITTVKRLPDGTIVKNKRFETEESRPGAESTREQHTTSRSSNQSNVQRKTETRARDTDERNYSRQKQDVVDNVENVRRNIENNQQQLIESHPRGVYQDEATTSTSYSSVKKSSKKFSSETKSETVEEFSDRSPTHGRPVGHAPQDFGTHGFPSVKPNKPTQEFEFERPHVETPGSEYSTPHDFPSAKPHTPTQEYPTDRAQPKRPTDLQHTSPRNVPTESGVQVSSSESTRTYKHKSNTEHVSEREIVTDGSDYAPQSPQKLREVYSIRESTPGRDQPLSQSIPYVEHPSSPRRPQPENSYSTHGFPSVKAGKPTHEYPTDRQRTTVTTHTPSRTDGGEVVVTTESTQTRKHKSNAEHVIETTIVVDDDYTSRGPDKVPAFTSHGFPSVKASTPVRDDTPRYSTPQREYPSNAQKPQFSDDYPTSGSPTARSPTKPDYTGHGFPSARESPSKSTPRPAPSPPQRKAPQSTTTRKTTNVDTTKRLLQKEREVDATHRAFAASLRSSSPFDGHPSDHQRHGTPRSSVSSVKNTRRDMREGSHDSTVPSETSRISSSTVTRQSPGKSVGKTVVTKQTVVKTKNVNGSNDTNDLTPQRSSKSPSPAKTITTTTTTTKTTTNKNIPDNEVPKPDNQITKPAENIPLFPINTTNTEPLTTKITKKHLSTNNTTGVSMQPVVEEPCIKKHYYSLGPYANTTANQISAESTANHRPSVSPSSTRSPGSPTTGKPNRILTDSIAARRNIFEKGITSKTTKTPTPIPTGRRPSYMDHTRSSLEHIRRDSLEINKTNYSRKSSIEEDEQPERRPNSAVKFDVPQKPRKQLSIAEDVNVEEIFDLEILEEMLETVTSYELRRRIRAQIRLVKKNMINNEGTDRVTSSSTIKTSTFKATTRSTNAYKEDSDNIDIKNIRTTSPLRSPSKVPQDEHMTTINEPMHTNKPRERSFSPDMKTISSSLKEVRRSTSPQKTVNKQYTHVEESDHSMEMTKDARTERNKSVTIERSHSPENTNRRYPYEDYKTTTRTYESTNVHERSSSPEVKPRSSSRNKSPTTPTKPVPRERSRSPQAKTFRQKEESYTSSTKKTVKSSHSPERKPNKGKPDEKAPIWADRKNILKNQSNVTTTHKAPVPSGSKTSRTTTTSKSTKFINQNQSKTMEEDSVTSSYGIGPTDENGLPLFGIKALKKKKQPTPSETKEEVTGYVVEEKYYSDNRTKPVVERKEYIYSTNADELENIKQQIGQKKISSEDVNVVRKFEKINKNFTPIEPEAILPSAGEFANTKYVRRGSVKEMSEKFIRKESSQSITEKSSSYPKAGLILRTNSRQSGGDAADSLETAQETYTTDTSTIDDTRYPSDYEYEMRSSSRMVNESESECESVSVHREEINKKSTTSSTTSKTMRSFLNSKGEEQVVTGVDDVLERMRNADNVVEDGDTAEDQEARALLNKFLGASVIMRGVEAALPKTATKQTKITTSYVSNNNGDNLRKQGGSGGVKTTRVTKTIKSGSSSSPVTRTTCDIEEIWDEDILKQLLEQATSYEERRRIRARLREIMAEREGQQKQKQQQQSTTTTEKTETKEKDGALTTTTTKVTTRTVTGTAPKPVSPFAKFRQLDKQISQQSPKSSSTPTTPGASGSASASPSSRSAPLFKFTDPALNARAATVKDQLLQWCQLKTQEYENVQITNFSTSWSDGLAFCALIHHFLPDAFDYSKLTQQTRRHNFELAFSVADEKAGIAPLLDVEDMVVMKRPDWKCVFVYVQSIYCRFRNCQ